MRVCGLVIGSFGALMTMAIATVDAQTYPSVVVDAQIPIVSSGLNNPQGLAVAADGAVYVADRGNHDVLKVEPDGKQTIISFGTLRPVVSSPSGIALDNFGNLYVTDSDTNRLIKLAPGAANGLAIVGAPSLSKPMSMAADAAGNLAIVNEASGTVTIRRYGGSAVPLNIGSTVLVRATAVAFDSQGLLYVADAGNGSAAGAVYRFPKLGGTGTNLTPAGYSLKNVTGLALDGQENLYILDGTDQQLIEIPSNGKTPFLIPQSSFNAPSGLALDNLGNIYVSDSGVGSNTVTEFVYHNAANFGSLAVGATSKAITFNYEFYERTIVEATRGIGGGVWDAEYKKAPGGTCTLRTYYPSTSSTGLTLPASCKVRMDFQPTFVGGRPGAVQLQTSNGMATQLTVGVGLGAQLAVLNAAVTTKVASLPVDNVVVNAADTEIYFSSGAAIYRMPAGGGSPTRVNTGVATASPVSLVLNGAGDLFILNAPTFSSITQFAPQVIEVPADGTAPRVLDVPGMVGPIAMAIDSNGALYITNNGPPSTPEEEFRGFVLRVSLAGLVSRLPGPWLTPTLITADGEGDLYIEDYFGGTVLEVQTGKGLFNPVDVGPYVGGFNAPAPTQLAVDESGTLYYWDQNSESFLDTTTRSQTGNCGNFSFCQFPLYTVSGIPNSFSNLPFYSPMGTQGIATSASGKMYAADGTGLYLIDRTLGSIPSQAFGSSLNINLNPSTVYVYNVGNQSMRFTDASRIFTQSGNGVGSFTFGGKGTTCSAGGELASGDFCTVGVSDGNTHGAIVTDTLHFLTNAVNNNSVSFKISGIANPAP
jgi:sugar lactone lactonase YvrE